jgi:hypothetical protein
LTQPLGCRCGTCPAFVADTPTMGSCHGDLPTVFLMVGTNAVGQPIPRTQAAYPPMNAETDWCAKHPMFKWETAEPVDSRLSAEAKGEA